MAVLPAILDVAIGMTLIFLTLSAICSSVNEIIANFLRLRAQFLEQGIMNLLGDPALARQVIEHPLLAQQGTQPRTLPSYIASDAFALALMDLLRRRTGTAAERVARLGAEVDKIASDAIREPIARALANPDATKALEDLRLAVSLLQDDKVRGSISNFLSSLEVNEIKRGVLALSDPKLQQVLLAILNDAETQVQRLEDVKSRIEGWFNNGMDQVSYLYKQNVQRILRVLAILACLLFNADAVHATNSLWQDPTLRAAIVAQAQAVSNAQVLNPAQNEAHTGSTQPAATIIQALEQLNEFPVGWSCGDYNDIFRSGWVFSDAQLTSSSGSNGEYGFCEVVAGAKITGGGFSISALLLKLAGLALMSGGVSLGAPFWFDALQKLLSLRPQPK
jgi:hypothetical protein